MINKPLTHAEVKEIKIGKPHVTIFPNRTSRRERVSKRNLVIQEVPLFDEKKKQIDTKEVLHKKITNLPRQYHGIKASKTRRVEATA